MCNRDDNMDHINIAKPGGGWLLLSWICSLVLFGVFTYIFLALITYSLRPVPDQTNRTNLVVQIRYACVL